MPERFVFEGEIRPSTNVLSSRYATPEINALFCDEAKIVFERDLWVTIMEAQADLGLSYITPGVIRDYEDVRDVIDLDSIRIRELKTKQDVNARLVEFNNLSGHEYANEAMTSRDLTENIEQFQILNGLGIIHDRMVATLGRFASRAVEYTTLPMAGRSHNVAGQMITLGKRFSNAGQELLLAYDNLKHVRDTYPLRGIKGAMGTQQDMLELLGDDPDKVKELERRVAEALGFSAVLGSVGQVYPRSLDVEVVNALHQASMGPSSFAKTVRLMAGNELFTEGFSPGQVGSNAMPHKMNARTSERINSLTAILAGNAVMLGHLGGDQWNEGDVSCSAARRVAIPDSFYAMDGLFEATLTVLDNMGAYPAVIDKELRRYLPFLTTTKALTIATRTGMDRQVAYGIVQEHSKAVALDMREKGTTDNNLFERLGKEDRLPVTQEELEEAVSRPLEMTGLSQDMISDFANKVQAILDEHPQAAAYNPRPLL